VLSLDALLVRLGCGCFCVHSTWPALSTPPGYLQNTALGAHPWTALPPTASRALMHQDTRPSCSHPHQADRALETYLCLPQVTDHLPLRSPHHQMSCKPTLTIEGCHPAASSLSAEGKEQHSPPYCWFPLGLHVTSLGHFSGSDCSAEEQLTYQMSELGCYGRGRFLTRLI